jgi:pimeloyl-ACP methyl ester carboxylesterase
MVMLKARNRFLLNAAIAFICSFFIWSDYGVVFGADTQADTEDSVDAHGFYVGGPPRNAGVIIFVHGLFGDDTETWTNTRTNEYWPYLIRRDSTFAGYDVYVCGFPSKIINKSYTIDQLSDVMLTIFKSASVSDHEELIFLVHSMGGLITRALLLKSDDIIKKTSFVYFFSTPTTGSDLANVANLISNNPQTRDTSLIGDNSYLGSQQSLWLAKKNKPLSFCAYEVLPTNRFIVVSEESATNLCTERLQPIRATHISIVKPPSMESLPYIAFKNAFNEAHRLNKSIYRK